MGSPGFAVPALTRLVGAGYDVAAVVTRPDMPAGRGRREAPTPVKEVALDMGLKVLSPGRPDGAAEELRALKAQVIVVAALGSILSPTVLELTPLGCLNIHPSLLPRYRGASPVASALLSGDEFAGVSLMLLDEGMDTGPVLAQAQVSVSPQDTTKSLTDKLARVGADLLLDRLPPWAEGALKPRPQDDALATYTEPLKKADGLIDWGLQAVDIGRRVRAFQPWPGCYTFLGGRRLRILEAVPRPTEEAALGEVVACGGGGFGVGTGAGVLELIRVQLEGGRVAVAADFIRGHSGIIGGTLPS